MFTKYKNPWVQSNTGSSGTSGLHPFFPILEHLYVYYRQEAVTRKATELG